MYKKLNFISYFISYIHLYTFMFTLDEEEAECIILFHLM